MKPRYQRVKHGDRVKVHRLTGEVFLSAIEHCSRQPVLVVLTPREARQLAHKLVSASREAEFDRWERDDVVGKPGRTAGPVAE